MSEFPQAVFLSYASQDAAAVARLAEALRAAGVEVWFDRNELVGGDAWDAKIRGQIAACALFVPVISAATQARLEGYFRLEWRLAAQRTHMMSEAVAFLLPVVIDATRDAEADVPAEFKAVQWTRLPGGEAEAKFCARVRTLLGSSDVARAFQPVMADDTGSKARATPKVGRLLRVRLLSGSVVAALAVLAFVFRPRSDDEPTRRSTPSAAKESAPVPPTKAQQLLAQSRTLYEQWDLAGAEDLKLAERLAREATDLDPLDADSWATLALAAYALHSFKIDTANNRMAQLQTAADRAIKLAPESDRAKLALAARFRAASARDDAVQLLRGLTDRNPTDKFILRQLGSALKIKGATDEALACFDRAAALPGGDPNAIYLRGMMLLELERSEEAEAAFDRALALRADFASANQGKLALLVRRGDVSGAADLARSWPPRLLLDEKLAAMAAAVLYFSGDFERAGRALANVSNDYLETTAFTGPKSYVAGLIHHAAGRTAAATAEWRRALRLIEQRLAQNPTSRKDLETKAKVLALLGDHAAAEETLRIYEQLVGRPVGVPTVATFETYAALGRFEAIADLFAREFQNGSSLRRSQAAVVFRTSHQLAPVRETARFVALTAEADRIIAEAQKASGRETGVKTGSPPPAQADAKSVAVLAFKNLSGDPAREFLSDGLSEAVAEVLGRVPGLKVVGSTSAFSFKGRAVPIPEIARQLGVTHVVEGTVLQDGAAVRISARLLQADGFPLWASDRLERELKNIFALHDEVAGLIAKQLSLKLGAGFATPARPVDPEAFRRYLEGRQEWNKRTPAGFKSAERLFEQAIALDRNLARAYVGLADALYFQSRDRELDSDLAGSPSEVRTRVVSLLDRALELDPTLAEAHVSRAQFFQRDEAEREAGLRRGLELNPNYATGHHWLALSLARQGRFRAAWAEATVALQLDPLSPAILAACTLVLNDSHRWTEALEMVERARALQPDLSYVRGNRVRSLLGLKREAEALALLREDTTDRTRSASWLVSVALAGDRATAAKYAPAILADENRQNAVSVFQLRVALGQTDEALDFLERRAMAVLRDAGAILAPMFDAVRQHPRFRGALAQVGLTDRYARAEAELAAFKRGGSTETSR